MNSGTRTPPPSGLKLGHVHLKVKDLEIAKRFYADVLGLRVSEEIPGALLFLTSGAAHHEIALQQLGPDAPAGSPFATGLYHVAFELPDEDAFKGAIGRLREAGYDVSLVDHRISWAGYLADPDGNGVEIYVDRRSKPGGTAVWSGHSARLAL